MTRLLIPVLPSTPLLLPLLALACGCSSGEDRPEVFPAKGTLTINGEPAEGALISLHPLDGENFDARGSRPWATVAADGSFAISTYGEADGAPIGEYRVSVIWPENPDAAVPVDRLGGRFARPEQSQWRVQIREGQNSLEPHEIQGGTARPAWTLAAAKPIDRSARITQPSAGGSLQVNWNKLLYKIHGWLGLNFGLPLFIICLSGTFAVVSHEIDWLLNPVMRVTPQSSRASYGEMHRAIQEAYPEARIRSVWAPKGPRFGCEFWVDGLPSGNRRVYVDPYTAEVLGEAPWFNTQRFFRDFHRRFFWGAWWGVWLVAAFGFVLFIASATGLAFYKRWWAKLFTLRWRGGGRLAWSDLHRFAGVWTLLFSLLIATTGIWYFVEIPLSWKIKSERLPKLPETSVPTEGSSVERLPVDAWVSAAQAAIPDMEIRTVWFPAKRAAAVRIDGQASAWFVRDRANMVLVDPYTGEAFHHQRAEQLSPYRRWIETADPLHFGDFGGLTSKLIWFALGLALSLLMPTGAYLWTRRAAQIAASTDKRLQQATGTLTDAERARLVHGATRRQTMLGIVSTTGIMGLACYATYGTLAKQVARVDPGQSAIQLLGGAGAIAVYAIFSLLILIAVFFWYRYVWFRRYRFA